VSIESTDWQESGTDVMSRKQQKLLNAACGDLAIAIPRWHGIKFRKDDYRHLIAAVALGERLVPGINMGDGNPGLIRMSRSSTEFTKTEATKAIRTAFDIGDNPQDQGLPAKPVRWCQTVVMARWIADESQTAQAA
jgi:hypothetical protein